MRSMLFPCAAKFYRLCFFLFFKRLDAERAHALVCKALKKISARAGNPVLQIAQKTCKPSKSLARRICGIDFPTPFGLAAGFDKDAELLPSLFAMGFGFVEVGSVVPLPQKGNPKPRLARIAQSKSLLNAMGFNSLGVDAVASNLRGFRERDNGAIIGVNCGKNRATKPQNAAEDYIYSIEKTRDFANFFVLNLSSPNTPGLRDLQYGKHLETISTKCVRAARGIPVFVKLAPELALVSAPQNLDALETICGILKSCDISGIVAFNTLSFANVEKYLPDVAKSMDFLRAGKEVGSGGISGAAIKQIALDGLILLREIVGKSMCIVSCGGVENAKDAHERLTFGADLVQGYTGFVYSGPTWAAEINSGIDKKEG